MIKILYPPDGAVYYIELESMLWGPIALPDSPPFTATSFRSDLDTLKQGKEYHGENDVSHRRVEGDLIFNPLARDMIPTPTVDWPHKFRIRLDRKGINSYTNFEPRRGLVQARVMKSMYTELIITNVSPTSFTVWTWNSLAIKGIYNRVEAIRTIYTIVGYQNEQKYAVTYSTSVDSATVGWPNNTGPAVGDGPSSAQLQQWFSQGKPGPTNSTKILTNAPIYAWKGTLNAYVGDFKNRILPSVLPHDESFPDFDIEDFGTMAARAVSKMDKTSSNMLEFISELRKPAKLIPKLKNLKKLKGWSEEYLRTQYGILPTISDLQNIIGMFRGAKPYFDKNGFSTYHAGRSYSLSKNGRSYAHSRQIKVATQSEENGVLALINRIDEFGFLPDAANLWDLVPFSFVLDWFVDVGSVLETLDMNSRIARLNIPYVTMSDKSEISVVLKPSPQNSYTGTLEVVSYQRWTTGRCPTPPLLLESDIATLPQNHWLEASALIVALKK